MIKLRSRKLKIFVAEGLSVQEFFTSLNNRGVRYTLLRWWRDFPKLDPGEDFDLLVHAGDYSLVEPLLTSRTTKLRCDVYFHEGTGGNRRKKVPYFPPKLANDCLKHRVLHAGSVYVPSPKHYFATLAYHAIFHKGKAGGLSGFPGSDKPLKAPEHPYTLELSLAAEASGLQLVGYDVQSIFTWLKAEGYAPPLDMLGKLADKHAELVMFAGLPSDEQLVIEGELFVFVIRRLAGNHPGFIKEVFSLLGSYQMETLGVYELDDAQVSRVSEMRGYNWGKGPYRVSGGPPHTVIVGYDWYPKLPDEGNQHSLLRNANLTKLKEEARRQFNKKRWRWQHCNAVHSADNEFEVFDYLERIDHSVLEAMKLASSQRKARFSSSEKILEVLSEGRRSRTDLIEFKGKLAVRKTYKIGFEAYCAREIEARRLFASSILMPAILSSDKAHMVMEHIANAEYLDLKNMTEEEKRTAAKCFVEWVRAFWNRGYFQADFSPRNILVTGNGQLHMIDFEFLQRYKSAKPAFRNAYEFTGILQDGGTYDYPISQEPKYMRHSKNWCHLPFEKFISELIND